MQKTPLSRIFREELIRATVFGIGFFTILALGFVSVAYAADGGAFGRVINLILTWTPDGLPGKNWQNPGDGTVQNALKIGGNSASDFVRVGWVRSCAPKCITWFDVNGNAECSTTP